MDKAPRNYMNLDDQGLYSSTDLSCDNDFAFAEEIDLSKIFYFCEEKAEEPNIFDFGDEDDLSKIFDEFPQEQPVKTTIIPSTSVGNSSPNDLLQNFENVSELPRIIRKEKQPMTTINCPNYSSIDKTSSRITHQINHDEDDDYSLSYIYSKGLNNVSVLQDGRGTTSDGTNKGDTINISRKWEQEKYPNTNVMILQQPLPEIKSLEKFERELSLKLKFTIDQPLRISSDFEKQQENPKGKDPHMTKNPCLEIDLMKSTYHSSFEILEQEKLMILNQESDLMKPKFFMNNPHAAMEQENLKSDGLIFQRPMSHILTLEKLESHLMKKSTNGGPIRRSPNGSTSSRYQTFGRQIDPNKHLEAYTHEITYGDGAPDLLQSSWTQSWNAQDSHFNTTTNYWPSGPFH